MDVLSSYRTIFEEGAKERARREPGWLTKLRKDGFSQFSSRGFPSTNEESWRFTSVAPVASVPFPIAGDGANGDVPALLRRQLLSDWSRHELVFVNGRWAAELSSVGALPEGVVVTSLAEALERHSDLLESALSRSLMADSATPFTHLNRAFFTDGAFVHVPAGTSVEEPIHLVFLTSTEKPAMAHVANVIVAGARAEARVVESYGGPGAAVYFMNTATDVVLADGAVVDHYKLQRESESGFHVASLGFAQSRAATLASHSISLGARLARNDIRVVLEGEGSDLSLNGLYMVRGQQHVDHHTVIDHKEPHCTSRELYKGILGDRSSGVFDGRIIVRQDAQKTNAQQSNKNLLLSENALVNTNPRLEIHADDVKCAHGATIGQLDADALFYLRTRGIGREEARRILTRGFMADVSDRIRIAAVREAVRTLVFERAA